MNEYYLLVLAVPSFHFSDWLMTAFGMMALPAVSSHELGGQEGSKREGLKEGLKTFQDTALVGNKSTERQHAMNGYKEG